MLTLADFIKEQDLISLPQIEKSFIHKHHRTQGSPPSGGNHHKDIKITSPFYKRIDQHPQNCKCAYHKRIKPPIKKIIRVSTQPNQIVNNNQKVNPSEREQQFEQKIPQIDPERTAEFVEWMSKLSPEQLNHNYLLYLKSLKNISKFKRHKQLDCHNQDFEKFLKNRYLGFLDKKKSQKDMTTEGKPRSSKSSKHYLYKMKTQGAIQYQKCDTSTRIDQRIHKTQKWDASQSRITTSKGKRIGFKGTQKGFQSSQEECPGDRKNKRNKTKFFSNRSSFFGLVEDQQLLREICARLMQQNRRDNKQADLMVKQLVEADIDLFTRLMKNIKQNLQEGLTFGGADQELTDKLVKIVLNKISKEIQVHIDMKSKDEDLTEKARIFEEILKSFGWNKDETPMSLKQFWKISQSLKGYLDSRKSLQVEKRSKMSRNDLSYSNKLDINKKPRNNRGAHFHDSRSSQYSVDKSQSKFNNLSSTNLGKTIGFKEGDTDIKSTVQKDAKDEQYRINTGAKNILKKGALRKKGRKKTVSGMKDGRMTSFMTGKSGLLARKETCFFNKEELNDKAMEEYIAQENEDNEVPKIHQGQDDRSSSIFMSLTRKMMRHIEANKKFLKRVETELKQKQISQFVIGISSGILTKKRKIRAINQALEKEQNKQSEYYNNLVKYLEIYEDYCDMAVKRDKIRKKSDVSLCNITEQKAKQKEEDQDQLNNLLYDLKKQRQLMYIDLKWLQDQEDPKEELIIQMPEFSTQIDKIFEREKKKKKQLERNKITTQFIEITKNDSQLVQTNLEYKVKMRCQLGLESQKETPIEQYPQKTSMSLQIPWLASKLQRYRERFNLSEMII